MTDRTRKRGACFRCGASLALGNCAPPEDACPDCGQCTCLRRYRVDYDPTTAEQ